MQTTLAAEARTSTSGKGEARKLRKTGKIPAVVYAGGEVPTHIQLDPLELTELFRLTQNRNTVVLLQIGGETVPCLVQDAQRHPLSRDILHVDFYRLADGQQVEVMVPVRGVGKAAGMAIGGRLRIIRREVRVRCDWKNIPASVDYDITTMEIGDMVQASDLSTSDGVELMMDHDFNVLTIYGRRVDIVDEPEAE
ncbi:MAG: large subunit ribosomal protein L25 [Kiritimatiellia bacterium]|jgi:large subunit ribosomal protein L25